jgi:hypothetical protein
MVLWGQRGTAPAQDSREIFDIDVSLIIFILFAGSFCCYTYICVPRGNDFFHSRYVIPLPPKTFSGEKTHKTPCNMLLLVHFGGGATLTHYLKNNFTLTAGMHECSKNSELISKFYAT